MFLVLQLNKSKVVACILAIILIVILWLNIIETYQKYLMVFAFLGMAFMSLLIAYVIVVLFITVYDELGIKAKLFYILAGWN